MEVYRPKVVRFVSITAAALPQYKMMNKDGSTVYVYDANFIRVLSEGLQVQYQILTSSDSSFGIKQHNGNWTGILGMILRSEADLAMGGVTVTEERYQAMNFSFPYDLTRVTFMTDKPRPLSSNLAIFYPFSFDIWIGFLILFFVVSLFFYVLMDRKQPLQRVMLVTVGSIFEQSLNLKMKSDALRIVILAWVLGVMILTYSYKAVLLSFLTFPTLVGIRDISDLSRATTNNSFKCFTFRGSYLVGHFQKSGDDSRRAIGRCISRNELKSGEVLKEFHNSAPNKAFIESSRWMSAYANDYLISDDSFFMTLESIPFSRNFCCPDRLNTVIHRIIASGLLSKIRDDNDFLSQLQRKSFESQESQTTIKIHLHDISGAFYILMSGWLLSINVLLAEILSAKCYFQRGRFTIFSFSETCRPT